MVVATGAAAEGDCCDEQ